MSSREVPEFDETELECPRNLTTISHAHTTDQETENLRGEHMGAREHEYNSR